MASVKVSPYGSKERGIVIEPGTTLGTFNITDLLGKGGMGEVYRATDSKLGRDVAIKVLPEDFAKDPERLARFEREAQTLASLNHSNVATVHGFEHDAEHNVHYLIMEYIDGQTMGERIASGALSIADTLPLFIDIAHGLDASHEAGIVHRDLKPDNVKINADGVVKILDFGIAKSSLESKTTDPSAPTTPMSPIAVTAEGTFMGTPVYMSPKQARGKTVDRRTDIWAFGCCLYEALTGDLPFQGETIADTVGAIMEREPDWTKLPDHTPESIRKLLERALEKQSRKRMSSAGDIVFALEDAIDGIQRGTHSRNQAGTKKVVGLPVWLYGAIGGLAIAFLSVWFVQWAMPSAVESPTESTRFSQASEDDRITPIAVLPLENMSSDPEKDYFANGMTEAITGELAKIRSLKVISRSSVMRYKDTELTMAQIAEELNVESLVTGSVQQVEDEVTISVSLIDPTTGQSL
ncbi:MAG: serine/threonine-protein kinase [Candidatus Hydrogenedentota bacterium]